jgi:hypothetical protein
MQRATARVFLIMRPFHSRSAAYGQKPSHVSAYCRAAPDRTNSPLGDTHLRKKYGADAVRRCLDWKANDSRCCSKQWFQPRLAGRMKRSFLSRRGQTHAEYSGASGPEHNRSYATHLGAVLTRPMVDSAFHGSSIFPMLFCGRAGFLSATIRISY